MSFIHIPKSWHIPASQATPEDIYLERRRLLKTMSFGGISALGVLTGCDRLNAWRPNKPNQDAILQPPLQGHLRHPALKIYILLGTILFSHWIAR
jgi:hypothetical protein